MSTPCSKATAFDALARGTIVSLDPTVEASYSVWPGTRLKMTPMIVDVERELRGELPGLYRVLVSAPANSRAEVATLSPSPVGVPGWLFFTKIDSDWVGDLEGMVASKDSMPFVSHVGTFASEAEFESELKLALVDCARTDFLFTDGGGRRGGPHRDRYLERLEANANAVDGGP